MDSMKLTLGSYVNRLSRCTQAYTNEVLAKYKLSSGTFPYLLELDLGEGINQNEISRKLNIDKAMSARAIEKLIKIGYVKKKKDFDDSRAFQLYLTSKGKAVIPLVKEETHRWNDRLTQGLSEEEKEKIIDLLSRILDNANEFKNAASLKLNHMEELPDKD